MTAFLGQNFEKFTKYISNNNNLSFTEFAPMPIQFIRCHVGGCVCIAKILKLKTPLFLRFG